MPCRRSTSGTSVSVQPAYPTPSSSLPYRAPSQDQSQRAALYIEGIGWSTPAAVSPRIAPPAGSGSGAVGSSPLGRQSSIMPDWSVAEDANNSSQVQHLLHITVKLLSSYGTCMVDLCRIGPCYGIMHVVV